MGRTWLSNRPEYKYLNTVFGLRCFKDILDLDLFPNGKEFTETEGMFRAVLKHIHSDHKDESITVVSVGDGHTPRTAAYFAFRTKWQCVSIDPALRVAKIPTWESRVARLKCYPNKVENLNLRFGKVIIVSVHSHAKDSDMLKHVRGDQVSIASMPCCMRQPFNGKPDLEVVDPSILSSKNKIQIWRNYEIHANV